MRTALSRCLCAAAPLKDFLAQFKWEILTDESTAPFCKVPENHVAFPLCQVVWVLRTVVLQ